ncbi:hypothetical protein BdWA1_000230 [Babesia duncani]|uniref:Uncharacterized protein n=1 Tax=Babesia duncani TaxID=323732 RepID=A0AAD9UPQ7_9APIC|nr:hypothetical protein BdWA1_000230 [Babesia duncani]
MCKMTFVNWRHFLSIFLLITSLVGLSKSTLASELVLGQDSLHALFTEVDELSKIFKDGSEKHKESFNTLLEHATRSFDVKGYKWMMDNGLFSIYKFKCAVTNNSSTMRFTQAISHPLFNKPHCDKGRWVSPTNTFNGMNAKFPGGPLRGTSGYDLTRWMSGMFEHVRTPASAMEPGLANIKVQAFHQVKGTLQSVIAVMVDLIPPMLLGMPLPCLPMLTGQNCLGSVLYPIPAADFTMADTRVQGTMTSWVFLHGLYNTTDAPLDLYGKVKVPTSPIQEAAKEQELKFQLHDSLIKSLDFEFQKDTHVPCKCEEIRDSCKLLDAYPIYVGLI